MASKSAYGDPRRPESAGRARAYEREKIGEWLVRWANVRLRNHNAKAVDKYAADIVKKLGEYVKQKKGELGELGDIGWRERARDKRREQRRAARGDNRDTD